MGRSDEFGKGTRRGPSADDHWNETYISGMSEDTEQALGEAYQDLQAHPVRYFNNCDETCQRVHQHLTSRGIDSRVVGGIFGAGYARNGDVSPPLSRDHTWLEVDGHIIDPTAGQFRDQLDGEPFKPEHYWKND